MAGAEGDTDGLSPPPISNPATSPLRVPQGRLAGFFLPQIIRGRFNIFSDPRYYITYWRI